MIDYCRSDTSRSRKKAKPVTSGADGNTRRWNHIERKIERRINTKTQDKMEMVTDKD